MNKTIINTLITTALVASLGFTATNAIAVTDFSQLQLRKQVIETQHKLKQAEDKTGAEQQKLINEHSKMLHDNMAMCRSMKPKAGMTEQERDEWYTEHQKIMDLMMEQMMEKEKVMMSSAYCEAHKK